MKIIFDNIIFSIQKAGGVSVYWYSLLKYFQSKYINLYYIDTIESNNIFKEKLNILQEKIVLIEQNKNVLSRFINPKITNLKDLHIFHSSYYRISRNPKSINILTVHDFIYEKKLKGFKRFAHIFQKFFSLVRAKGVICISNSTRNDMFSLYPFTKRKLVKVIYNGYDNESFYFTKLVKHNDYVLFVGGRTSYKNFYKAVDSVSLLPNISLYIVGSELNKNEMGYLEGKLKNRFKHFHNIDTITLNELYSKSICLLYLSEYEGFGIPILEAMAAGCPVIALNKSSIPEVAGNAAVMFDKIEVSSISNVISILATDDSFRKSVIEKGLVQSRLFSWDQCAEETEKFYLEVMNQTKK